MAQNEIFSRYALILCNFVYVHLCAALLLYRYFCCYCCMLCCAVLYCAVLCTVNRRSTFKWSKISTHRCCATNQTTHHLTVLYVDLRLELNQRATKNKTHKHSHSSAHTRIHTRARSISYLWVLSNDAFLSIFDNIYALAYTHSTK